MSVVRNIVYEQLVTMGDNETQDRQYTRNVTLRRFRVNIVLVEKQYVLHILDLCILIDPACKAHAPHYTVIWPVRLYHIFPHYPINVTIFGES